MTYLSDRRRVALAIYPRLLAVWMAVAMDAAGGAADDEDRAVLAAIKAAEDDAYAGLDGKRVQTLRNRVKTLAAECLEGYEQSAMVKVFLMVAYALRDTLESGALVLVDGSPLDVAYSTIAAEVSRHEDLMADVDRSAEKHARKLRERLAGYLPVMQEAAE
ncbi:MAG: hypothetical protein VR70_05920 [Rhodospirillaceae bacterium BRH_c57]|nr:MAG: hypothetical protein VR70_05920 [Rhodospirillaceae bacterium BRH_c57]